MVDMSGTITPKSDQLNADDMDAGPMNILITGIKGIADPKDAQPIAIQWKGGDGRPYKPCKSMRRVLVGLWGVDGSKYVGRYLTLYRDPQVKFGGIAVGGIRISHASHIDAPMNLLLTATRGSRKQFTVRPYEGQQDQPEQDEGPTIEEAMRDAEQAASGGTDAFKAWWNTEFGKSCRELVRPALDRLKGIAADVDEAKEDDVP